MTQHFDPVIFVSELKQDMSEDELTAVDVIQKNIWLLYPTEETFNASYKQDRQAHDSAVMIVTSLKKDGIKISWEVKNGPSL